MLRFSPNLEQHLPPFSPSPGSSTPTRGEEPKPSHAPSVGDTGGGGGSWEEREHHLKSTSSLCPRPPSLPPLHMCGVLLSPAESKRGMRERCAIEEEADDIGADQVSIGPVLKPPSASSFLPFFFHGTVPPPPLSLFWCQHFP